MKQIFTLPVLCLLFALLVMSGGCAQEGLYSKATEPPFFPGIGQPEISPVILGFDGSDIASAITLDYAGNIIIAGQTTSDPFDGITNHGTTDAFISKQNPDGTRAWTVLLDGALYDYATDVTTDTAGNIYVCGTTTSNLEGELNAGSQDAFLVKLDPAGNILATRLVGDGGADRGRTIAVDTSGNIYMGGYTSSNPFYTFPTAGDDAFIAKFDGGPALQWVYVFEGAGDDEVSDIICDPGDSLYVTGITGSDPFEGTAVGSPSTNSWVVKIPPGATAPVPPSIYPPYIAKDG